MKLKTNMNLKLKMTLKLENEVESEDEVVAENEVKAENEVGVNIHSPSPEHKISLKTLSSRKKSPEQVCSFNLGVQFFMLNVT